jgi:hypothetical protein
MTKEIAKFLSGFFAADVLAHVLMRLAGWVPFTAFGIHMSVCLHNTTFVIALLLSVFLGFYGWKK